MIKLTEDVDSSILVSDQLVQEMNKIQKQGNKEKESQKG